MNLSRRRGTVAFFITLGVCLTVLAVALNITWMRNNGTRLALDLLGAALFSILIAGVVLNTVFLVREIRRNERQDSFLNAVTHELKTPIASIRLYLDTLQKHHVEDAKRAQFYGIMRSDTDRLLSTVERILKAGELGQRKAVDHQTRVELGALVAECVRTALERNRLPAGSIQLADVPGDVPLRMLGNAEDLRTAVMNLLDNAVKYSPGGVQVRCRLSIEDYTWVMLAVSDTGIGIASHDLQRIFKRFFRAGSADRVKIKGTGLGLFLVRTIARQHGGSVRAASEGVGKGSTMYLRLPMVSS